LCSQGAPDGVRAMDPRRQLELGAATGQIAQQVQQLWRPAWANRSGDFTTAGASAGRALLRSPPLIRHLLKLFTGSREAEGGGRCDLDQIGGEFEGIELHGPIAAGLNFDRRPIRGWAGQCGWASSGLLQGDRG